MYYEKYEELCKKTNTSSYKVAKETGINPTTLSQWKNGKYTPKIDTLKTISNFFNVPVSYITGEDDDKKQSFPTYDPRIYEVITLFDKMTDKQKNHVIEISKEFANCNSKLEKLEKYYDAIKNIDK